jgi:hypothetical protein
MVRGHGRRGTISRDCRMICYTLLCIHFTRSIVHRMYYASRLFRALHIDFRARVVTGIVVRSPQPLQTGIPLRFTN